MIFNLVQDFADALSAMPAEHPRRRILKLLKEALRRDVHFINCHPTTLFQCLWNSCWWYDCPEAAQHYDEPESGWTGQQPAWLSDDPKLYAVLEEWRTTRTINGCWARSLRPPANPLGSARRAVLIGHESGVTGICFAPDGRWLASVSSDGTLRIWDVVSGKESAKLVHRAPLSCVAISPDGRWLATGSNAPGETIRLWDANDFLPVHALTVTPKSRTDENAAIVHRFPYVKQLPEGESRTATCLAFSADAQQLASGGSLSFVWLWDVKSHSVFDHRGTLEYSIKDVAFSPNGQYLAACGYDDGLISLWDARENRLLLQLDQISGRTYQPPIPNAEGCISIRMQSAYCIAFSPDCRWLAAGSRHLVRVWDLATGTSVAEFNSAHAEFNPDYVDIGCVAFAPDSRQVVFGETDQHRTSNLKVRVWDWKKNEIVTLSGHEGRITGVAFSPDGRTIASCSEDGTIGLWDATGGAEPPLRVDQQDVIKVVRFTPNRKILASDDRLWDSQNGHPIRLVDQHKVSTNQSSFCFSADSRWRAFDAGSNCVSISDATTGRPAAILEPTTRRTISALGTGFSPQDLECPIRSTAFDQEGRRLAALDYDGNVRIWDILHRREIAWIPNPVEGAGWPERYECDGRLTCSLPTWRAVTVRSGEHEYELLEVAGEAWTVLGPADASGPRLRRDGVASELRMMDGSIFWLPNLLDPISFSWDGTRIAGATGRRLELYVLEGVSAVAFPSNVSADAIRQWHRMANMPPSPVPEVERSGADAAVVCPRCGYRFQAEVLAQTRAQLFRPNNFLHFDPYSNVEGMSAYESGQKAGTTITCMTCLCGLDLLVHWPSRIALHGIPVTITADGQSTLPDLQQKPPGQHRQTGDDSFDHLRDMVQRLKAPGGYSGSHPHPAVDPNQAMQLNLEYQRKLAEWKALPRWKRWFTKRPDRPTGI